MMRRSFFIVLPVDCLLIVWYVFYKVVGAHSVNSHSSGRLISDF